MEHIIHILWTIGWTLPIIGFFGIGMGPSKQEKQSYGNLTSLAGSAGATGTGDAMKASDFWSSILSGDMNKIAKVLGPQISSIAKQGGQQKKTTAEFGNRSGGNNAVMQSIGDSTRSSVDSMVSSLTGTAGSELGSLGSSLMSQGMSGFGTAFGEAETMQKQQQEKWGDIFKSISDVVGVASGFAGKGNFSKALKGAAGVLQR